MAHQVPWTKLIVEEFIKDGMLSKEEEYIIRTRAVGHTITQQAEELHMSTDNVSKIIARLKKKYDMVQRYNPLLPPRRFSAKETYMDEH